MRSAFSDLVPYNCVQIDATQRDFFQATQSCFSCNLDRSQIIKGLQQKWTHTGNQNQVLALLSVRTGLDLYLSVMQFARGSEIIVSAINIPSVIQILRHHGLHVVPLDIDIASMTPKAHLLKSLTSERTVALLVAEIYGRLFDMTPFIEFAHDHGLVMIEDCAEAFCGFDHIGHPGSDVSFFSFGPIKYCTAFGGAIAKIRSQDIYQRMKNLYASYPVQSYWAYLKKIIKYYGVHQLTSYPTVVKPTVLLARFLGINHQGIVLGMLRGFPGNLVQGIHLQPSTPLLATMLHRFHGYSSSFMQNVNARAEYVTQRLPEGVCCVGEKALVKNHWLFPILVEKPDVFTRFLISRGVDAYRGATQLNVVEADAAKGHQVHATEAHFLIEHVVYLPVNGNVPYAELDRICQALREASVNAAQADQVKLLSQL
ncbi:hypothetical protein CAPTEDRAFT_218055 [Capitella teleta]|uniref:Aminotransferase class V domain-containing protein n=1 Tax=Capitella teleta TaxID=283909 RepID=R7U5G1_CAPTE|nr:hypothetical protein CAPTEDRAFT_218055 [Capitella teleta]|eukprot:ELT98926.1 hypothetical protein CAPTEDRAFT_218055 [Capitella teleta]